MSSKNLIILIFTLILTVFSFKNLKAQWVTIPNANFAGWLQTNFPTCMNGNLMDTTCAAILNETYVQIGFQNISNLTGIQYFKNLDTLNCGTNPLNNLPQLPDSLKFLYCVNCQLTNISILPNFLKTLNCVNNQLTSLPTLPSSLTTLYCGMNNITSLPSLPSTIKIIDCNDNSLGSIPALPNSLSYLNCGENNLSSLPILPSSLKHLACHYNNISSLPNLPDSLTYLKCNSLQINTIPTLPDSLVYLECSSNLLNGLPILPPYLQELYCLNTQTSILPSLPATLKKLYCQNNQLTSLTILPNSLLELWCSNNQLNSLPSIPVSLQKLNCQDNQLNSIPSLPNSLIHLNCYNNLLSNLPALPSSLQILNCNNNQLTSLPTLPSNLGQLNCSYNQLTSLPNLPNYQFLSNFQLNCSNNSISCFPVFTTSWNNTGNINISNNPVTCVQNYVSTMDSTALSYPLCLPNNFNNNPQNCPGATGIVGSVYKDTINNCVKDTTEPLLYNIPLKLYNNQNSLISQTYSLQNGFYNFADSLGVYTVKLDTTNAAFAVNCNYPGIDTTVNLSSSQTLASNVDFSINCSPGFDVGVQAFTPIGLVFPGQTHKLKALIGDLSQWYGLNCATGLSGQVVLNISGPAFYVGIMPGALTPIITGNTYTYPVADFGNVNIQSDFGLYLSVDTTAQASDQICVSATVTPLVGDNDSLNNSYTFCYDVLNSYDPNKKETHPQVVLPGYNDYITYTIHFQNTGNAPAINIHLKDTLDDNLDLNTFELINFSHANSTWLNGNQLSFNFPNIQLPDSGTNMEASQGFVQYRIKPLANLPAGTIIQNTAYIYFDYNAPIITNTTENNFNTVVGNQNQANYLLSSLKIYPNPANSSIAISGVFNDEIVKITDITGSLILETKIGHSGIINISNLKSGLYFIQAQTKNGLQSRKFIKD